MGDRAKTFEGDGMIDVCVLQSCEASYNFKGILCNLTDMLILLIVTLPMQGDFKSFHVMS